MARPPSPSPGDQGGHGVALALGDQQERHHHRPHPQRGAGERHQVVVHVGLGLRRRGGELRADGVNRPVGEPHRDPRQREVEQDVEPLVHQHREAQVGQEPPEDPHRRQPGGGERGGFEFAGGPARVPGGEAGQETAEEEPEEPLRDPGERREDGEADELPEREPEEGPLDGRGQHLQQAAGVPGVGLRVELVHRPDGAGGDAPRAVVAAAERERREPDREGGEDGGARVRVEVLRVGGDRAHPHEEAPSVEDGLELSGDLLPGRGGDARLEVEGGGDLLPGNLGAQLAAEEGVEGGARAAEVLGDRSGRRGLSTGAGAGDPGAEGEGGGEPEWCRSEWMTHGGEGRGAAYAWQDSNLRPTD